MICGTSSDLSARNCSAVNLSGPGIESMLVHVSLKDKLCAEDHFQAGSGRRYSERAYLPAPCGPGYHRQCQASDFWLESERQRRARCIVKISHLAIGDISRLGGVHEPKHSWQVKREKNLVLSACPPKQSVEVARVEHGKSVDFV